MARSLSIILFLSRGNSISTWDKAGILDREMALYEEFVRLGHSVSLVSWGRLEDFKFRGRFKGIQILHNSLCLPTLTYERFLPWLHASTFRQGDIFKTNQSSSAPVARKVADVFGKMMVMRFGFMWSANVARELGADDPRVKAVVEAEEACMKGADHIVCTTDEMAADMFARVPVTSGKTTVLPNYVVPASFDMEYPDGPYRYDVLYVGRFSEEKNVFNLVRAARKLNARTLLVGKGPLEAALRKEAENSPVEFMDFQPQSRLKDLMRESAMLVMPSMYEGHPKVLIEAMFAGVPVVGTDVPGIQTLIKDGVTGLLCGTDADSLAAAIQSNLKAREKAHAMAWAALQDARKEYAVDSIALREIGLYEALLKDREAGDGYEKKLSR